MLFFFFFFQAEDGIRDYKVTGVQTCALPISPRVGLAYAPNASGGFWGKLLGRPGETSIRAGFGVFFTAFEDITSFNEVGDAPYGFFWVSPVPPLFATPFMDRATGNNEGQRFPPPFPPLNVSSSNPDNNIDWSKLTPHHQLAWIFPRQPASLFGTLQLFQSASIRGEYPTQPGLRGHTGASAALRFGG